MPNHIIHYHIYVKSFITKQTMNEHFTHKKKKIINMLQLGSYRVYFIVVQHYITIKIIQVLILFGFMPIKIGPIFVTIFYFLFLLSCSILQYLFFWSSITTCKRVSLKTIICCHYIIPKFSYLPLHHIKSLVSTN